MFDVFAMLSFIASAVTAVATAGTMVVILYTFRKNLPGFLSERYTKPMDSFFIRKEFFEDEAEIMRVVLSHSDANEQESGGRALVVEAFKPTKQGTELRSKIKYILAHYEVLFYGMERNLFDEGFIRELMYGRVIGHYKVFKPYIEYIRKENGMDDYMEYFEKYALKWQRKA